MDVTTCVIPEQKWEMEWLLVQWLARYSAASSSSWSCGSSLTRWRSIDTKQWRHQRPARWSKTWASSRCTNPNPEINWKESRQLSLCPLGGALARPRKPPRAFPRQPQPETSMLGEMSQWPRIRPAEDNWGDVTTLNSRVSRKFRPEHTSFSDSINTIHDIASCVFTVRSFTAVSLLPFVFTLKPLQERRCGSFNGQHLYTMFSCHRFF